MDSKQQIDTDVIIIGGGAAGLMCAAEAAKRGRRVVVLDHGRKPGRRILLAGGGKCNFTNRACTAENFISNNPHFCKSALAQYSAADFLTEVEAAAIAYEERDHGRLFCLHSAGELVKMLTESCRQHDVILKMKAAVGSIEKQDRFTLSTGDEILTADALVVATGGLSYPQAGASDWGYQLAHQFGLATTPCRPGLVPLLYPQQDQKTLADLTGIALEATVSCRKKQFTENVLFTHNSLSGPAILQISNYWQPGDAITIDWLPGSDVYQILTDQKESNGASTIKGVLAHHLPNRMTRQWAQRYFPEKALAECSVSQIRQAADSINRWTFLPSGSEGYAKAEVTVGGIDTNELSSKTLESKKVEGLYFIGEVIDVTGQLGGYNLQWAWSSGFTAGQVV
ncbi:MAG: BaiN/RdsA family NAD(P)/FAD-dependent oxidoreductase [Planctomycetota bacterium]|jgi:predicted Rossmann fold flavoprotein